MKLQNQLILFFTFTIGVANSQSNEKFVQLKRNEINISMGAVAENLFGAGGERHFLENNYTPDLNKAGRIGYRRYFRKFAIRAFYEYNSILNPSGIIEGEIDMSKIPYKPYKSHTLKIGYERIKPQVFTLFEKKRNLDITYGVDLIGGTSSRFVERGVMYIETDTGTTYFNNIAAEQQRLGIGLSPFLGIRLPIGKHWSISTDIAVNMQAIIDNDFGNIYLRSNTGKDIYSVNFPISQTSENKVLENDVSDVFSLSLVSVKQTFSIGFHF